MPLLRFTYHVVPDGRPDSVNSTLYFFEKTTFTVIFFPLTVNDPPFAPYAVFVVDTVYV